MNSLIQGAAKKGHYMFELVKKEIEKVNPRLMNLYGLSMAILDYLYWMYPEDTVMQMSASGQGQAGQEEVDFQTDPPTVKAKGSSFPILVHELLKGVYDILGSHGLPDDPRQAEMVKGSEDTLPGEVWDSLLGKAFYKRLLQIMPAEFNNFVSNDSQSQNIIQLYLINKISLLSPDDINTLAQGLIKNDPKTHEFVNKLAQGAKAQVEKLRELPIQSQPEQPQTNNDDDDDDDNWDEDLSWLDDEDED